MATKKKAAKSKKTKVKTKPKAKRTTKKKAKAVKKPASKKAKPKKKAPAKEKPTAKKAKTVTATDQVLNIIKRSKKGVDVPTILNKTGLGERTVRSIVFKANKEGKIKRVGRGVYVGA